MKKIRSCIAGACAVILASGGALFITSHGTWLGYNDWLVVGKNYEEVEERYGEFDCYDGRTMGYYVGRDQSIFLSNDEPLYYWMNCDDNGVVTDVYVDTLPGGS